jgi:hypothetical protein
MYFWAGILRAATLFGHSRPLCFTFHLHIKPSLGVDLHTPKNLIGIIISKLVLSNLFMLLVKVRDAGCMVFVVVVVVQEYMKGSVKVKG